MKVLIADDEAPHAFLLEMFLRKWGYQVFSTGDGQEALRMLDREQSPCIAILDWEMPGLDGVEVSRRIRGSGKQNIYILMLSAKTQSVERAVALQAGVHQFMAKPFDPEELRRNLLAGSKALERLGYSIL